MRGRPSLPSAPKTAGARSPAATPGVRRRPEPPGLASPGDPAGGRAADTVAGHGLLRGYATATARTGQHDRSHRSFRSYRRLDPPAARALGSGALRGQPLDQVLVAPGDVLPVVPARQDARRPSGPRRSGRVGLG